MLDAARCTCHLSEPEIRRRHEREELLARGLNPYSSATFDVTATAVQIKADYKPEPEALRRRH